MTITDTVDISEDLAAWAIRAGYFVTQGPELVENPDSNADGRAVIWKKRGETRYFVGKSPDGWTTVTSSDRMSDEILLFAAESLKLAGLYFYGMLGLSLRIKLRLPFLKLPYTAEEVADGYELGTALFGGQENWALIDKRRSAAIEISASGKIGATTDLACLSRFVEAPVEAIKASYLDQTGQPLFVLRDA